MNIAGDILNCIYCRELSWPNDDSQLVEKGKPAHTSCAWRENDAFLAELDAEHAAKVSDDDAA